MKGLIARILPFSSVDGPGNRSVVFLQGCNFDCLFCHNPETIPILKEANESLHVRAMRVEEVISELDKVKVFTSGVTISGGECTVQYAFLLELVKALKAENYNVFIDTNGNLPEHKLEPLLEWADGFMVDFKSAHSEEHRALTGADNANTIRCIHKAAEAGKLYEIRTVIIPDVLDNAYNVSEGAALIAKYDTNIRYKIIKYRQHGVRKEKLLSREPTNAEMNRLKKCAEAAGCTQVIIV